PVLFDVGANLGVYTGILLKIFGSSAQIWAFEPAAETFRMLEANMDGVDNVQLVRIGLSDREGSGSLYAPGPGSKLSSLHAIESRLDRLGLPVRLEEKVALTTIDSFCKANAIDRIDFLKLDVEGHELSVLHGAQEMLDRG